MRTALLLAGLAALPVPGAHAAAVVSSNSRTIPDYGGISTSFNVIAAGDAKADDIQASGVYGDFKLPIGVLVTDKDGATAGGGCEQVDPATVRCMVPLGQIGDASVGAKLDGGAGDDLITAAGAMGMTLAGGPGRDTLTGGDGPDKLLGGGDADVLNGADADVLEGGAGADRLIAPASIPHRPYGGPLFDGGPGPDVMTGDGRVTYEQRRNPVRVDLRSRRAVQGQRGEHDTISGPNGVTGGRGADTLIAGRARAELSGGPGKDHLIGGPKGDLLLGDEGSDVLDGRGGNDALYGGHDHAGDRLLGGPGNDQLSATPGPDVLIGGSGDDLFAGPGHGDVADARDGHRDQIVCASVPLRILADAVDRVQRCPSGRVVRGIASPAPWPSPLLSTP